jgi:hypothetical protein
MTQRNGTPLRSSVRDAETGSGARQVPARPHDSGSQANETVDGLDAITEALRYAVEDTASGTGPPAMSRKRPFLTGPVKRRKSERRRHGNETTGSGSDR